MDLDGSAGAGESAIAGGGAGARRGGAPAVGTFTENMFAADTFASDTFAVKVMLLLRPRSTA